MALPRSAVQVVSAEHEEEGRKVSASVEKTLNLSHLQLTALTIPSQVIPLGVEITHIRRLALSGNHLNILPCSIAGFSSLKELDISSNQISWITGEVARLPQLEVLIAKNNRLSTLPKEFGDCSSLRIINFSGNSFDFIPRQIIGMRQLKELYLGANQIAEVHPDIGSLQRLRILYLGGNNIKHIPPELGRLHDLRALILCDNKLTSLPRQLSQLQNLQTLSLHKNLLSTLPMEIVMLGKLQELSLRDNPLVNKFVHELDFNPPSLLELSGRCVKVNSVPYSIDNLPMTLVSYLNSARRCINPACNGVYFDARVRCVKFVDFCGKFRLPLEQFLCSPHSREQCTLGNGDNSVPVNRLQKVLLPLGINN